MKQQPMLRAIVPAAIQFQIFGAALPAMAAMWLEMKSRGYWLTSADRFLVEIAATLMAGSWIDRVTSGDVSP